MSCTSCDLYASCANPLVQSKDTHSCDLLVVGDMPSKQDEITGEPFSLATAVGRETRRFIKDYFKDYKVRYTYAVRCRPPYGVTPKAKHLRACKQHLLDEVNTYKPKAILLLGNTALEQVMKVKGITNYQNKIFNNVDEFSGIKIIATYHPSSFLKSYDNRDPGIREKFFAALQNLASALSAAPAHALFAVVDGGGLSLVDNTTVYMLSSIDSVNNFIEEFRKKVKYGEVTSLSYDIEASTLSPWGKPTKHWPTGPTVLTLGFAFDEYVGYCIPYKHPQTPFSPEEISLLKHKLVPALWDICGEYGVTVTAHNWKYDALYSYVLEGWDLRKLKLDDPMLMHTLLDVNARHGLKELDEYHGLGNYEADLRLYIAKNPSANPNTGKTEYDKGTYANIPLDILGPYNGLDAIAGLRIRNVLYPKLLERNILYPYHKDGRMRMVSQEFPYKRIMRRVAPALITMEMNGLALDEGYHAELCATVDKTLASLMADIMGHPVVHKFSQQAEEELNIGSSKQLSTLFFDYMKLPDNSGKKSVAKEWLQDLSGRSKLVSAIVQARKLMSLKSKYLDNLTGSWMGTDKLLHTNLNLHVTRTGRTSSSNPNHQNVPRVKVVKRQFIPTQRNGDSATRKLYKNKKNFFVNLDYSQLELRIIADIANEIKWLDAFERDEDIHIFTAMDNYGLAREDITEDVRTDVKSVNFGVNYKMGAKKLRDQLNRSAAYRKLGKTISVQEAKKKIDTFFQKQKYIADYHRWAEKFVCANGYIPGMMHRFRSWPDAKGMDPRSAEAFKVQREAVNMPIQNSGSELMLLSICRCYEDLFSSGLLDTTMNLTVHDSLLLEVVPWELEVPYWVQGIMEYPQPKDLPFGHLNVKLKVDAKAGYNYADMVSLDEFVHQEFGYVFSW